MQPSIFKIRTLFCLIGLLIGYQNTRLSAQINTATQSLNDANLSTNNTKNPFEKYDYLTITNIDTRGNKRTQPKLILREIDFVIGDSLSTEGLEEILEENRNQIYNTGLFNDVRIKISKLKDKAIGLLIEVEERWYIYPVPIFELTDRNFNVWWNGTDTGKKRDFKRTEYGFRFIHENFRGRREKLKATIQFGFTKKFELGYYIPFIDKQQKTGISPSISYILNTNISYQSENNKILFFQHDAYARKRFRLSLGLTRRPNIHMHHYFNVSYFNNSIVDTIAQLNPNYFLEGKTKQEYFYLAYIFNANNTDIQAYPLKGNSFRLQISKAGLGIFDDLNMFWAVANYAHYFQLSERIYGGTNVRARFSSPKKQAFFNQSALGFGTDYVRGYEDYIIGMQSYIMFRNLLKYKILDVEMKNPIKKFEHLKALPISLFLKTYAETAYSKDDFYAETNPLANQWLWGTGFGLDIVTAYDNVFSLEYSFNRQKEHGFYVSFGVNFN